MVNPIVMAERPVFIPRKDRVGVIVKPVSFTWFSGFAPSQKMKSVASLHEAAMREGCEKILEISSKGNELGQAFSAFNLRLSRDEEGGKAYYIENIFQGSKVFEKGGPYTDIYDKSAREAKKDERLKSSGRLIGFEFFGEKFPLEPKTFFYDYIYINALMQNEDFSEQLLEYDAFTDIEFNPERSLNCQAYSAALYVSLSERNRLGDVRNDKEAFLDIVKEEYESRTIRAMPITQHTRTIKKHNIGAKYPGARKKAG